MLTAFISLALGGNILVFILLMLAAIGASILFYRYTLPPLPSRIRITFSVLRSISLVLMIMMLFEPIFRSIIHTDENPTFAVLVDDSQSMTIKDGAGDRAGAVQKLMTKKHFTNLPSNVKVHYYSASSKLKELPKGLSDSLSFKGETTDLSTVLAQLKEHLQRENIQAAVLVTDGNYNTGKNPLYDAEALGIPIYSIGVGDTNEQKDILIQKLITNNIAYAEARVPVDVTIKSSGYKNEIVEVTINEGSTMLDRKVLQLQEGTHEYPLRLYVEPKEEGTKKYTVSVSKLAGELTDKNNARSFFMKILRSKLRIVLIGGVPSPDVSAVRQALVEDERYSVRSFVQKNGNEFYESGFTPSVIDSADCLVLVGFPSSSTNSGLVQQLKDMIEGKKKPVFFVNGKQVSYDKLKAFEQILPFVWSGVSTDEIFVFPSVSEKEKAHPLVTLEGNMTSDGWQQLPPIYKTQTMFKLKPESEMIAAVKMQNVVLAEPLISVRNINRQKTFAITGQGLWRWRLLAQNNSQTEKFLPLFISNAVRWLTTKEDEKNVRVTPVKEFFTTAEPVEFTGQVYDEQLKPVSDADLSLELMRDKEKFQIALQAIGDGRYEGSIEGIGEGDYIYIAKATAGGRILGEDKGGFSVGQMNLEFLETKMNKQLLEQIAYRTGGKYYDVNQTDPMIGDLQRDVKFTPKEIIQTSEIELWNWKYLAAAIILLLGTEWFLRKRNGML